MAALLSTSNLAVLGFIFFFSGLAFKISLVPFHFWTADVYQGAPISITSFLSVISKGSAVMILMIIGGLNWGLAIWDVNLVTLLLGAVPVLVKIVYALVGLSAVYELFVAFKK